MPTKATMDPYIHGGGNPFMFMVLEPLSCLLNYSDKPKELVLIQLGSRGDGWAPMGEMTRVSGLVS